MNYDKLGQAYTTTDELCDMLYKNPDLDISRFNVVDAESYNKHVKTTFAEMPLVRQYAAYELLDPPLSLEDFDKRNQNNWYMPNEYKQMDIAQWVLDQCKTDAELQRVGEELLLFMERDLFTLLQYLKFMVDTFRKHNIVLGLGRGSSTASYVLYLIGVHKINSLYYDLPIEEFLK